MSETTETIILQVSQSPSVSPTSKLTELENQEIPVRSLLKRGSSSSPTISEAINEPVNKRSRNELYDQKESVIKEDPKIQTEDYEIAETQNKTIEDIEFAYSSPPTPRTPDPYRILKDEDFDNIEEVTRSLEIYEIDDFCSRFSEYLKQQSYSKSNKLMTLLRKLL